MLYSCTHMLGAGAGGGGAGGGRAGGGGAGGGGTVSLEAQGAWGGGMVDLGARGALPVYAALGRVCLFMHKLRYKTQIWSYDGCNWLNFQAKLIYR